MTYEPHYEQSHALLIGIDTYQDPRLAPLGNAEDDAQTIAQVLVAEPYNFNVKLLLGAEATRDTILDALYELRDTDENDRILVYFAGHGYTITNRRGHETGYIACADTLYDRDYTALELDWVTGLRDHAAAKHIGFIFDACFSGAALGLTRAASVAAAKFLERRAYQVISAGAADQTVSDVQSMTTYLVRELRQAARNGEFYTLTHLAISLRDVMSADSRHHQIPQFGHLTQSQGGDLVLVTPTTPGMWTSFPQELSYLGSSDAGVRLLALERVPSYLNDPKWNDALLSNLDKMLRDETDEHVRARIEEILDEPHNRLTLESLFTGVASRFMANAVSQDPVQQHAADVDGTDDLFEEAVALVRTRGKASVSMLQRYLRIGYMRAVRLTEIMKSEGIINESDEVVTQGQSMLRDPIEPATILIPAGPFYMCNTQSEMLRESGEPEQVQTNLDYDYAIGQYPVTVGEYREFIVFGGYRSPRYWTQAGWEWRRAQSAFRPANWEAQWRVADDGLPVVGVSWYEAYAYTCWLASETRKAYRLPTEPEWEKAARGGLSLPDGLGSWKPNPNPTRIWPWGNEKPTEDRCNFDRNVGRTTPVGLYPNGASPYGVMDMAGNVWEWCLSEWVRPKLRPQDIDVEGKRLRVLRGGSWFGLLDSVQGAYRIRRYPHSRTDYCGFRVVCDPHPLSQ